VTRHSNLKFKSCKNHGHINSMSGIQNLTPNSKVRLEKLIDARLVKISPTLYRGQRPLILQKPKISHGVGDGNTQYTAEAI
jgi:hypothetical protein